MGFLTIWRLGSQGEHPLSKRENDVTFYDLVSVTLCHVYCILSQGGCLQGGVGRERMQLGCAGRESPHAWAWTPRGWGGGRLWTRSLGLVTLQCGSSGTLIILSVTWPASLVFLCCVLVWTGWREENPASTQNVGLHCSLAPQVSVTGLPWSHRLWVGGGVSRGGKIAPLGPPGLGKSLMQRGHVKLCHGTVSTRPHSLSVRWRSMLPLYRGENRLRAGKRRARSHS